MASIAAAERPRTSFDRAERGSGALGPTAVVLALGAALATFVILLGFTPIDPSEAVVVGLLVLNVTMILLLLGTLLREAATLLKARRAGLAGARLHVRVVSLFSMVSVGPVMLVTLVGFATLHRGLDPWFAGSLRQLVDNSGVIVREYQQQLCQNIGRESQLMSVDLERAWNSGMYQADRALFLDFMRSRALSLGFPYAAVLRKDGAAVETIRVEGAPDLPQAALEDFDAADSSEPPCLISPRSIASLRKLRAFGDSYIYAGRPANPQAIEFGVLARAGILQYQELDVRRRITEIQIGVIFALITLIVLLSSVLMGLRFANRLIFPIRRLIQATDEVSSGNLYVQVPLSRSDGDLGHLGSTFNKMTAELRSQNNRLTAASDIIDARRRFMEAVLSGVPAGVIGLDRAGLVTLLNPTAERVLGAPLSRLSGAALATVLPAAAHLLEEVRANPSKVAQEEIRHAREGKERTLSVRVAAEQAASPDQRGFVVTLDDITDLVMAQRMSAWADVARRIAHEIKNPLTPIQLSAERIRRRYGKVITQDREVFDQCTDTIIRQVDDIKRMVDEFSSFARMPKPRRERDDLCDALRQTLFLMRVGYADVTFEDKLPGEAVTAAFDRRLVGQAVQNIMKNAVEAMAAGGRGSPVVSVSLDLSHAGAIAIDVKDNGPGFPSENRQALLEPYMTTRDSGTGLGLPIVAKIFEEHGGRIELLDHMADDGTVQGGWVRLWIAGDASGSAQGAVAGDLSADAGALL